MRSQSEVVKGLAKLRKRVDAKEYISVPTGAWLREWRMDLRNEAMKNAPNWKGGIIRSIQSQQDSKKFPLWARVYSEVPEARWADLGTGRLSIDPQSPKRAYRPPTEALTEWATDHDMDPYVLARSIFRRGGTPPTRFFQRAAETADLLRNERLARFALGIEREASRTV